MPETPVNHSKSQPELISHHIFLLPFKWSREDGEPYRVQHFQELTEHLDIPAWTRRNFKLDKIVNYNEFQYFYDYVTEVLYQTERKPKTEDLFIAHYEYDIPAGKGRYCIKAPDPKEKESFKTYELEIDSVLLHLYYTGVGVLSFHLNNRRPDQKDPEDIISINQYGRRVFPPFYFIPPEKVGYQLQFEENEFVKNLPSGIEIAHEIGIYLPGPEGREEYKRSETWKQPLKERLKPGEKFKFRLPAFLEPFLSHIENGYDIFPILDDRMYVVCWYGNNMLSQQVCSPSPDLSPGFLSDSWWYRFAYVDGKYKTVQNAEMQRALIKEATYRRWSGYGSLYGITEYSLVLLTKNLPSLREDYSAFLVTHLQSIYYRLAELVLVQRASVQRFSDDITHISKLDGSDPEQTELAGLLNQRYIRFVNRIYFREVTAQVQGIEMYDRLQQQCRIEKQVHALQEEIERLQAFIRQETDRKILAVEKEREAIEKQRQALEKEREAKEKERWDQLTLLGSLLVPPALLLAAYDLNYVSICFGGLPEWQNYIITIAGVVISAGLSYWAFQKNRAVIWTLSGLAYLLILTGPVILCHFLPVESQPADPSEKPPVELLTPESVTDSIILNDTLNISQ